MTKLGAIVTTPNQSPLAVITVTYSPGEYLGSFLNSLPGACARGTKVVLADLSLIHISEPTRRS